MTDNTISIEELLKKYNIQPHDLEYILNFMQKESISPQLAMRRIKLFEKLQEKMSQTQSDEKVRELTTELDHLSKLVEDLQKEKVELDKEIEDTRLEQDLFNAEREELKLQMHALMGSLEEIEEEAEKGDEVLHDENKELNKKVDMMTTGCQTLKTQVLKLGYESPVLTSLVESINVSLEAIIDAKQIPQGTTFTVPQELLAASTQPTPTSTTPASTQPAMTAEKISANQIKFRPKSESQPAPASSSKPLIKENIFAEPEEVVPSAAPSQPVSKPGPKPEPKPEVRVESKPTKVDIQTRPVTDEKAVSDKIEKILTLFISYGQQADSDENWKARISAICDMDEAYVELGGLAMSQIYAYQTQSIKKKKEFERLLTSWIENGIPR